MQIVTIHANSTSARIMQDVGRATHHISLPGHDDVPLEGDYSLPMLREYVQEQIGESDVIFIGNSVGGMLAHQIADKVNTRAIISVAIPPLNYDVLDGFMQENTFTAIATKPDLSPNEVSALAKGLIADEAKRQLLADSIRGSDPHVRSGLLASIMVGDLRDEYQILSGLDIPILFIACKQDVIVNNTKFTDLPFGEVLQVEAGHLLPYEQPELFNSIVDEFLERHGL
ncbi:MAG: alpha/beta fold hydrolase [Opitutaceae bacterium]